MSPLEALIAAVQDYVEDFGHHEDCERRNYPTLTAEEDCSCGIYQLKVAVDRARGNAKRPMPRCNFQHHLTRMLWSSCRVVSSCVYSVTEELEEKCLRCDQSLIFGGCGCERSVLSVRWPETCMRAVRHGHWCRTGGCTLVGKVCS